MAASPSTASTLRAQAAEGVVPATPGIQCHPLTLPHGITLACRRAGAAGPERPTVLLLHGFPEAAFVWDEVMLALAPQACCLAPDLRGYGTSSRPAEVADYRPKHLVADAIALIDHLAGGADRPIDLLVAHDWGGGVAWNLAALVPHRVRRLVIINAPHPGALLRELRDNPEQQAASRYMNDLVQPDAARRLADDDFAALWSLFDRLRAATWLTPTVRARYRTVWAQGLDGALNYYRASPLRPPAGPADQALHTLVLPPSVVQVAVPTTVLWGDDDAALRTGLLEGLSQWVPQLQIHRRAGASHWIVHEQPDWVIGHLRVVLASLG